VRTGNLVVENDRVVRVTNITRSKSGKHGHAKVLLHLVDPITQTTSTAIHPTFAQIPLVRETQETTYRLHSGVSTSVCRYEMQLLDADHDRWLSLLDQDGNIHVRALQLPPNSFGKEVMDQFTAGKDVSLSIFQTSSGEAISLVPTGSAVVTPPPGAAPAIAASVPFGSPSGLVAPPASTSTSPASTSTPPTPVDVVGAPGGPSFLRD